MGELQKFWKRFVQKIKPSHSQINNIQYFRPRKILSQVLLWSNKNHKSTVDQLILRNSRTEVCLTIRFRTLNIITETFQSLIMNRYWNHWDGILILFYWNLKFRLFFRNKCHKITLGTCLNLLSPKIWEQQYQKSQYYLCYHSALQKLVRLTSGHSLLWKWFILTYMIGWLNGLTSYKHDS